MLKIKRSVLVAMMMGLMTTAMAMASGAGAGQVTTCAVDLYSRACTTHGYERQCRNILTGQAVLEYDETTNQGQFGFGGRTTRFVCSAAPGLSAKSCQAVGTGSGSDLILRFDSSGVTQLVYKFVFFADPGSGACRVY